MRFLFILLFCSSLLLSPAQGQTRHVPYGNDLKTATVDANYDYHFPFNPTVGHVQNIISSNRMGQAFVVNGMRFRPDGARTGYRPWPIQKVTNLTIGLANHPGPQYADRYSFKGNQKSGYTLMANSITLNLPACPLPTTLPEPFSAGVDIKFPKPFFYNGKAGFLVDIHRAEAVYQYNRWYIDAHLHLKYVDPPTGTGSLPVYYGTRLYLGAGCPTSFWTSIENAYPGASIITYGQAMGNSLPVLIFIGNDSTNFVPGVPLPFDLGFLGAPTCSLQCNWLLQMTTVSDPVDPNGVYRVNWGQFPHDSFWVGVNIYSQAFALDPKYNAMGLRVSRGRHLALGPGFPGDIDGVSFHLEGAGTANEDRPSSWYPRVMVMELY